MLWERILNEQTDRRITHVSVNVTRKVGIDEVTFTAHGVAERGREETEFLRLSAAIAAGVRGFIDNVGPHLPSGNGVDLRNASDCHWFPVSAIRLSDQDGNRQWKAQAGKWSKWGIIVYPEVWERSQINPIAVMNHDGAAWYNGKKIAVCIDESATPPKVTKVGYHLD